MLTDVLFEVVKNHEEQYSIWPACKAIPKGWSAGIFQGPREECLDKIQDIWKDMRPKSLREALEKNGKSVHRVGDTSL